MDKTYDDKKLFLAIKRGNEKAFTALYERYWEKLYFIAYRHTQSVQESEDLIHEIFIELWKNRKKIEIKKGVSNYIFTALKYKIFRLYDSRAVRKKYSDKIQNEDVKFLNSTENELSFNELYGLIEQETDKLPEKCKVIFRMRRIENYSIKEISEILEISPNTVNNQISKASKIIKVSLRNHLNSSFF